MVKVIPCNGTPCTLTVEVKTLTNKPEKICLVVKEKDKPATYYANRFAKIHGRAKWVVKMPVAPATSIVKVWNKEVGLEREDNTIAVRINKHPIEMPKSKTVKEDAKLREFIKFATGFAKRAGYLQAGDKVYYVSRRNNYRINYLPFIPTADGSESSSPARITCEGEFIQVSQKRFKEMTVPMRIAILLHEWSHCHKNVKKSDEIEADYYSSQIYLQLGFPLIDCLQAWLEVFGKSPSAQNFERYQLIKKRVIEFDNKLNREQYQKAMKRR